MPDSALATAARAQKAALAASDRETMQVLAKRWLGVERALEARLEALAEQIARSGKTTLGQTYKLERYQKLILEAQAQYTRYAAEAAEFVTTRQMEMVRSGVNDSVALLRSQIGTSFTTMSTGAVESIIAATAGMGADGAPLRQLFYERMVRAADGTILPGVQERLMRTLTNALAQGWHPTKTAKLMKGDLAAGLDKALQIARTEQIRAYRLGTLEQYKASGVVHKYVRMSAHAPGTCLGCLALEGTVYDSEEDMGDHPQGMCTVIPQIDGMPKPEFQQGEDYVRSLPEDAQKSLMGPTRYKLWTGGKVKFSEFGEPTEHAVWGAGVRVTPVGALA